MPARYWLDLRAYDPVATAASLDIPTLILQGGRDYQVTEQDFAGWRKGLGDAERATFRLLPNLNHAIPEVEARPLDLLARKGKIRQRASRTGEQKPDDKPWSWDDDQ